MSLKDTFEQMKDLLANITVDLQKSEHGNKAASQRVRTGTVKLEKIAKLFRKESIVSEKKDKGHKKHSKTSSAVHKTKIDQETTAKHSPATKAKAAAAVKAKAKPKIAQASVKARQLSVKKATAKLPTKAKASS